MIVAEKMQETEPQVLRDFIYPEEKKRKEKIFTGM